MAAPAGLEPASSDFGCIALGWDGRYKFDEFLGHPNRGSIVSHRYQGSLDKSRCRPCADQGVDLILVRLEGLEGTLLDVVGQRKDGYIGELREPAENVVPDCNQSLSSLIGIGDGWPVFPCLGGFVWQSIVFSVWPPIGLTVSSDS